MRLREVVRLAPDRGQGGLGRVLACFLFAAVATTVAGAAAGMFPARAMSFVLVATVVVEAVVALPAFLVLRRVWRETWLACAVAGAVTGLIPAAWLAGPFWAGLGAPGSLVGALFAGTFIAVGVLGGLVFRAGRVVLDRLGGHPTWGRLATPGAFGAVAVAVATLRLAGG